MLNKAGLYMAVIAIFAMISPLPPEFQRDWQEIMLLWGGMGMLCLVLADTIPLKLLGMWLLYYGITDRSPATFSYMIFYLTGLGIYRAALQYEVKNLIRIVAVSMVGVMILQAADVWVLFMRWIIPNYKVVVYNNQRILTGWTGSSADAAVVLAMALPFFFQSKRTYIFIPFVLISLFATQSTSGIVAGLIGMIIAAWPGLKKLHRKMSYMAPVAWAMVAAFGITALNKVDNLKYIFLDDRWKVWAEGFRRLTFKGYGLGAWETKFPFLVDGKWYEQPHTREEVLSLVKNLNGATPDHWPWAHFDFLQFGFDAGIIGMVLIGIIFVETIRKIYIDKMALGAMAALAVCEFGHFTFYTAVGATMALLVFGEVRKMRTLTKSQLQAIRDAQTTEEEKAAHKPPQELPEGGLVLPDTPIKKRGLGHSALFNPEIAGE